MSGRSGNGTVGAIAVSQRRHDVDFCDDLSE
jgi:hypothetical protein